MPYTFDQSKDELARLVRHFSTNQAQYRATAYKEAHARQEFIDPMFIALNWDVHNQQYAAPDYREVVIEDSLDIEGQKKAPDYVFRVGNMNKFYAEAKRPGMNLKTASGPAYQLRRYAWSAKLPLSILTDFEELAIYDCRLRPSERDKPSVARMNYLTYDEYPDRWSEIWDVFSHDAVWGGSFDQFSQTSRGKRGTSEVDEEFLKEIEKWRELLAHNFALRNPKLTLDEMNDSVQRTIDRIIFLRMAEDRNLEPYGRLRELSEHEDIYSGLLDLSRKADAKYNSGLFDFSKTGDQVTPRLVMDDKPLKSILGDLYFPQSPYEFSVIPAEILGNVYEQFLGKVIRLTAAHQAKVEEKPEVKKSGGIYYTPAFIVNYIVKNTVGKQVEGKSPKQLQGFRVLDMACGSGSFLIGAYQCLLDFYLYWYAANKPEKNTDAVWRHSDGGWRLTTSEKKRILNEHIFGVDIDRQAVEVTKLSLLLKVLEGEKQAEMFHERALPNLDKNIKCGNSLIGTDYFAGQLMTDGEELRRVNAFDWTAEFPEAMKAGGFNAVIGNPPYFNLQTIEDRDSLTYFQQAYTSHRGKADILFFFVEKAKSLLIPKGVLGFIVAHYFLKSHYADKFRALILSEYSIQKIVDFGNVKIFKDANVDTCIILLKKGKEKDNQIFIYGTLFQAEDLNIYLLASLDDKSKSNKAHAFNSFQQNDLTDEPWQFQENPITDTVPLSDICYIGKGAATGNDNIFVVTKDSAKRLHLEKELLDEIVNDSKLSRYNLELSDNYLIRSTRGVDLRDYPNIQKYLLLNKNVLINRFAVKKEGLKWYEIVRYNRDLFSSDVKEQIFAYYRSAYNKFAYSDHRYISLSTTFVLTHRGKHTVSLKYLIGILNSRFMESYSRKYTKKMGGVMEYSSNYLQSIPIKIGKKEQQDKMVLLVEQMLDLHKHKAAAKDASEQERLERLIDSTEREIDELVYELYGLTQDEIALIGENNKKQNRTPEEK